MRPDEPERAVGCLVVASGAADDLSITPPLRINQTEALRLGFRGATGALDVGPETWAASFTGEGSPVSASHGPEAALA